MRLLRRVIMTGTLASVAAPALLLAQPNSRPASPRSSATAAANSDGVVMRGPVLGYVFDSAQMQLRPLTGVAGAASIDTPLAALPEGSALTLAPGRDFGIGRRNNEEPLSVVRWSADGLATQALPDSIPSPGLIVFSPRGTTAALFAAEDHRLQVWTGLPDTPALVQQFTAPAAPVASLAVSDDGLAVVAGLAGEIPALQLLGDHGRTLASGGSYPAVQFARGSHNAVYVDGNANQLIALEDVTSAAASTILATDAEGIADPIAIAVSGDGAKVVALNRGAETLTVTDAPSRITVKLSYERTPQEVTRLSGDSLFRLNSSLKMGITLLDLSGDAPRLLYIPTPGDTN